MTDLKSAEASGAVRELMLRYLAGELQPHEVRELNQLMLGNRVLQREFAYLLLQEVQLIELGAEQRLQPASVPAVKTLEVAPAWWTGVVLGWSARARFGAGLLAALGAVILFIFWDCSWLHQARITELQGSVLVVNSYGQRLARPGTSIQAGDQVRLSPDAAVTLGYRWEPTQLRLTDSAILRLGPASSGKVLFLDAGSLSASVASQAKSSPLRIVTAQSEVKVVGTEFFVHAAANLTRLEVWSGKVELIRAAGRTPAVIRGGQSITAAAGLPLHLELTQGGVLREAWRGIAGSQVGDLTSNLHFPEQPDETGLLPRLELASKYGDSYGLRLRGWLHAPQKGPYQFWIAADDEAELWISSDETAAHKKRACFTPHFTGTRDWESSPDQNSKPMLLLPGRHYYVEILMKQSGGAEHLAVAWQGPHFQRQIVDGNYLTPYPRLK